MSNVHHARHTRLDPPSTISDPPSEFTIILPTLHRDPPSPQRSPRNRRAARPRRANEAWKTAAGAPLTDAAPVALGAAEDEAPDPVAEEVSVAEVMVVEELDVVEEEEEEDEEDPPAAPPLLLPSMLYDGVIAPGITVLSTIAAAALKVSIVRLAFPAGGLMTPTMPWLQCFA